MDQGYDRRDFLKLGATIGAGVVVGGLAASGCSNRLTSAAPARIKTKPKDVIGIGLVGIGVMGSVHCRNMIKIDGVELRAVCDLMPERVERAQRWAEEAGQPRPDGYGKDEWDFKRMCEREDLDLILTATPWEWHVPICVAAMKAGKHAATEVPAALTIEDCWRLVETSEKTGKHCVMMENCCYDRTELMILNMVRKGMFGELTHASCGYLHDLRALKFSTEYYYKMWRLKYSVGKNADLYPTHGLGPVAQCMNINRGNQFDYIVSMSNASRGLNIYAEENFGPDSPHTKQKYALGDIITTLIRTVKGQTIVITHDTNSPRPYTRNILVQGTKGIVRKYPQGKIHIEGKSPAHRWEELKDYYEEYDHPLYKQLSAEGQGLGHGSMDYMEDYRLIHALRTGTYPDMDVYDAAAWSAVVELSGKSIANRSRSIDFPDFTRGKWKTNPPLGIVEV